MNRAARAINRLRGGVAPPRQLFDTRPKGAVIIALFKVVSVQADYLVCNPYDGIEAGTDAAYVALPYLLRRSPFDGTMRAGITYTYTSNIQRTASDGSDTETQVIVPSYEVGDLIFAVQGVTRGTAAESTDAANITKPLDWLDLNTDGRAWAKDDS